MRSALFVLGYLSIGVVWMRLLLWLDEDAREEYRDAPAVVGMLVLIWPVEVALYLLMGIFFAFGWLSGGRRR